MDLDDFFGRYPDSGKLFEAVRAAMALLGPTEMRVTKSQIAFRRRKAYAWAWVPARYLRGKLAPLVPTIFLPRRDSSRRWKEIVEPAKGRYTHHLEIHSAEDVDREVLAWLREAWEAAA